MTPDPSLTPELAVPIPVGGGEVDANVRHVREAVDHKPQALGRG
ncbi:hypothetical protein [Streptomyces althioticus]